MITMFSFNLKMEKIKTKEEIESGQKKKKMIVSLFLLGLLVLSTLGYALLYNPSSSQDNQENQADNNAYAIDSQGRYVLNLQGQSFSFANPPESAQEVPVNIMLNINNYKDKAVFLVSNDSLINSEIYTNLGGFAERVQLACYGSCELNLPEKNCTDMLIILNSSLNNKVYQQDNCVFIEGDLLAVDAFLYRILGR